MKIRYAVTIAGEVDVENDVWRDLQHDYESLNEFAKGTVVGEHPYANEEEILILGITGIER